MQRNLKRLKNKIKLDNISRMMSIYLFSAVATLTAVTCSSQCEQEWQIFYISVLRLVFQQTHTIHGIKRNFLLQIIAQQQESSMKLFPRKVLVFLTAHKTTRFIFTVRYVVQSLKLFKVEVLNEKKYSTLKFRVIRQEIEKIQYKRRTTYQE